MRKFPLFMALVLLSAWAGNAVAASVRTMANIPGLPTAMFRTELPAKVYRQLASQPVKAYLMLRAQIIENTVTGARVIKSDGNGVYDKAAVQIANGMRLQTTTVGTRVPPYVVVHLLVYQLPKGEMVYALAQNDSVGDTNLVYARSLRIEYLGLKGGTGPGAKRKGN